MQNEKGDEGHKDEWSFFYNAASQFPYLPLALLGSVLTGMSDEVEIGGKWEAMCECVSTGERGCS